MVCAAALIRPVKNMLPHHPASWFQSGSWSVPVLVLPYCNLMRPPALKKYLAELASANVTVCVNVMVQAEEPEPVAVVLLTAPTPKSPYSVPDTGVLPRLIVTLVRSVATAGKTVIRLPLIGAVLAVNEVLVWLQAVAKLLTKVAHCVAVIDCWTATVGIVVCPQPLSPVPAAHTPLRLALGVVLTNPL